MARVILICGKICSGKSTYAERLRRGEHAVLLSVDEIMLALFGLYAGDKHDEYARKTREYLMKKSVEIIESGCSVILDWGFWQKSGRAEARAYYQSRNIPYEFHYIDVDESIWRARIADRNRSVTEGNQEAYFVDDNLLEKFEAAFEAPTAEEIDVWVQSAS